MASARAIRLSPSVKKQKLKLELLRGSKPKFENLPVSVVVHEHLVRAGCMFFGTTTRRTLTRLHRPQTVIHSGTVGIQRKVTKLSCFWYLLFRTLFQHLLGVFWRSLFALQLALVSMITITLISSLSVFSLQRARLFRMRTRGEQGCIRGEQGPYFKILRRLDVWLFSWMSHRSRESKN